MASSAPQADVEVFVFLTIPATLFATLFGLRAMGEIRYARGRQTGRGAANFGLSVGALVTLASVLAIVL